MCCGGLQKYILKDDTQRAVVTHSDNNEEKTILRQTLHFRTICDFSLVSVPPYYMCIKYAQYYALSITRLDAHSPFWNYL